MFTQCPECATVYSLSPADLRAANGFVRCGQCDHTFNALSRLQDTPPIDVPQSPVASPTNHPEKPTSHEPPQGTFEFDGSAEDLDDEAHTQTQQVDEDWARELVETEDFDEEEGDWFEPDERLTSGGVVTDVPDAAQVDAGQEDDAPEDAGALAPDVLSADDRPPADGPEEGAAEDEDTGDLEAGYVDIGDLDISDADMDEVGISDVDVGTFTDEYDDDIEADAVVGGADEDHLKEGDDAGEEPGEADDPEQDETPAEQSAPEVAETDDHADDDADHDIEGDDDTAMEDDDADEEPGEAGDPAQDETPAEQSEPEVVAADDHTDDDADDDIEGDDAAEGDDAGEEPGEADDPEQDEAPVEQSEPEVVEADDHADDDADDDIEGDDDVADDDVAVASDEQGLRDVLVDEDALDDLGDAEVGVLPDIATPRSDSFDVLAADLTVDQEVDDSHDQADILSYLRPGLRRWQKVAASLAILAMLAALTAQAVHHWRSVLVLDERVGPRLQRFYQRIGRPTDPAASYRDYEVARHTIVPRGTEPIIFQLRATIINRANGRRPYPYVRVTFYDRFGDESLVRTFEPDEFLTAKIGTSELMPSGARADVALDLVGLAGESTQNYYVEVCAPLAGGQVSCDASADGLRPSR